MHTKWTLDATVKPTRKCDTQDQSFTNPTLKGKEATFTYIKSRNRYRTGGQGTEKERQDKELNTKLNTVRNTKP